MICQLCGRKIGLLRRFVDREFCSAAHRYEARYSIDRSLADFEDEMDDSWAVARSRRRSNSPSQTASVLLLVVAGVLILATISFSSSSGGALPVAPIVATQPNGGNGLLGRVSESVARSVRGRTPATLTSDFHSGLNEWINTSASTIRTGLDDWAYTAEGLKPGKLRIWKRSTELSNYELDFLGRIDRKSMGWAYRATDPSNYYGTKLTITKTGPGPNAGLVRYVMMNGRELDRVQMPLPLTLNAGEAYRVRVRVRGDHFITSVNGQIISAWSDRRLKRGGVGFFTEEGESATVKWVSVSERDSLLGRVLAYFSLIQPPSAMLE